MGTETEATGTPLELRIAIGGAGERGYESNLQLLRDGRVIAAAGNLPFELPLGERQLAELRWYLEQYIRWPAGPFVERARTLEQQLPAWGAALFDALFDARAAFRVWQQFKDTPLPAKLVTVAGEAPAVLQLPWELLADGREHLFALDIPVRRYVPQSQVREAGTFTRPVRILLVVARPEDEGFSFLDHRASPGALLDVVEALPAGTATVEFLHPPTAGALQERLRDRAQPAVHVLHFDGHGVYVGGAEGAEGQGSGGGMARAPHPLLKGDPQGAGYLAFEDRAGGLDLVSAGRLGNLLAGTGIPLAILDACQSAAAVAADPFSSIAPRLVEAGVGSVVAMQYSVLVPTTRLYFGAFYRALAAGRSVSAAADEGRRALYADPTRTTIYYGGRERPVRLHDWFLPALYQRAGDPVPFRQPAPSAGGPDEAAPIQAVPETQPAAISERMLGDFPEPRYEFSGRSRELWQLERRLAQKEIVVVHGFGGQGKTALAAEAARWLLRTGRFRRALFLSLEAGGERAWAVAQMGRLLLGAGFAALGAAAQEEALLAALAATPTLVVWDNAESVLPGGAAEAEGAALGALLDLGAAGGRAGESRLLVTTRVAEIPHDAYRPGRRAARLPLAGLALPEALAFAGRVLDGLDRERPRRERLLELIGFLGGHPLSLQLVLPHLRDYGNDVEEVIRRFDELYPGFTEGKATARDESLAASLQFSLDRLGAEAQARLDGLGVFEGGAAEVQIVLVAGILPSAWRPLREELLRAGLAAVGPRLPLGVKTDEGDFEGHYLRFHPTLAPALRRRLRAERRAALEGAYRQAYYRLANYLYRLDRRSPHEARAIAARELPNLRRALALAIEAGEGAAAVDFADSLSYFLGSFGRRQEQETWLRRVEARFGDAGAEGVLTKAATLLASRRGELLLSRGRAAEAEAVFRQLLARLAAGAAYDAAYDRALTLGRLGRCLKAQGRVEAAEAEYRRALAALSGLAQEDEQVRRQTGVAHTDLGDVLTDQGHYGAARAQYEAALAITKAVGDERGLAVTEGQLGTLALMEGDYAAARRRYREALARFRRLGETQSEAIFWHQLGMAAEEEGRLAEAAEAYGESVRLSDQLGDTAGAAQSANQLAIVAERAGRPAGAERWYRRAIEANRAAGNQNELARNYSNLANLLLAVHGMAAAPPAFAGRDLLAEAERRAQEARRLKEEIGDLSLEPWKTYSILAEIAAARNRPAAARAWRRRERAAFAAFPGNRHRAGREMDGLIRAIAAAVQGDAGAVGALQEEYPKMKAGDNEWQDLPGAIRRLLEGERALADLADAFALGRYPYLLLLLAVELAEGGAAGGSTAGAEERPQAGMG